MSKGKTDKPCSKQPGSRWLTLIFKGEPLTTEEQETLNAHLAICDLCREAQTNNKAIQAILRDDLPAVEPPQRLRLPRRLREAMGMPPEPEEE